MKRIINIFLTTFILALFPLSSSALVMAPPPSCNFYPSSNTIVGNTFRFQSNYVNGLLTIHIAFNSSSDNRNFNLWGALLRSENCDYLDSINELPIHVPEGVSNVSLRFTDDDSFQFFDDSTGNPLACDNCQVTFIPRGIPPYKFQFFLNTDFNSAYVESKPYEVRDPNFQPPKTPVLLIPGSLATDINKGNEKLWLDIKRLILTNDDRFMDPLGFNDDGTPIDTSLTLGEVLAKPDESFDYSQSFINEFANQNYLKNERVYLFPYDWRKNIAENALGPLKQKIDAILASTTSSSINIIAHSQGGLLIKRLLYEKPEYQSKINKLIFVGTPNLGAPKSFKILREGDQLGIKYKKIFGLDPEEIVRISKNMPSVYEMLPSQEYFNHYDGYWGEVDRHLFKPNEEIFYNYETTKQKLKDAGYNAALLDNNDQFHTFAYDQFDFSNSGIQVYNIAGCQTPTYGGVIEKSFGKDKIIWVPGDETVPLKSAANVVGVNNIYAFNATHGTMLTQDGIRQKIVNLITGGSLPESGLTANPTDCHFNGEAVSVHSPVDLNIYDQLGRHVGPTEDGNFDYQIPNVGYETIGHEKFAFLPEGNTYSLKLNATGSGEFTFDSSTVVAGQVVNMAYYDSIAISTSSAATINLNPTNDQTIQLDANGDGTVDSTITPSSILNANESLDLIPPVSTSTLSGLMGQNGFYRSDVAVNLSAADPVIPGHENETSGMLKTNYQLDDDVWQSALASSSNLSLTLPSIGEGNHTLTFFSTDRAGNNEPEQTINFTIDKTAPEASIQFNPSAEDLQFTGLDNLSTASAVTVLDNDDTVTLTDQAGNVTEIKLKDKDRKHQFKAEIKSLSYNNIAADLSKNQMRFEWHFDKQGNLQTLEQKVQSKKDFSIQAKYGHNQTVLSGKDQSGKINEELDGLVLLKVATNKGDLGWGY